MKMNILIDSGNCKNIGDNAMLFNLVDTLATKTQWNFFIIDKNAGPKFHSHNSRVKFVNNNNNLLKMPNWRINCNSGKFWLSLFLFFFGIRMVFLYINVKFFGKFKFHLLSNRNIKFWTEIFEATNGYWVVGGGNINDMGLGPVICKMAFARLYRLMNKPVIFSGQTIGPINKTFSRLIVNEGIKNINLLSLRERESYKALERLGCDLSDIYITADDALTLKDINSETFKATSKKIILLNFRFAFYSTQNAGLLAKYALLIDRMLEVFLHEDFLFVPLTFGKDDSDIETAERILESVKKKSSRIKIYKGDISHENIQGLIKKACLSIGVSYHFCLFSLSNGVPTIGLYANEFYAQKLKGLMEMFGQKKAALNLVESDIDSLIQAIGHVYGNFVKDKTLEHKKEMVGRWNCFIRDSIEVMENKHKSIRKEKFNICVISSGLEHIKRGVETWANDLSHALKEKYVHIMLYKGSGIKKNGFEKNISCIRCGSRLSKSLLNILPSFSWHFGLGSAFQMQQTTFAFNFLPEAMLKQFDIIHTQDPDVANILRIAKKVGLIKSKVILAHGTEEDFEFIKKFDYLQHLAPLHLEEAKMAGLNGKKSFVIPNFVNTERFKPLAAPDCRGGLNLPYNLVRRDMREGFGIPGDAFVVLCVAAIKSTHKRIDYLINEMVKTKGFLVVAGSSTDQTHELKAMARKKLKDRFIFLTDFPHERMNEIYRIADVFTLCSLKEMMPIALLEALSSGLPSIVNKHPVVEWMVGDGGESIDMSKEGELAKALEKYMDESYRKDKGRRARRQAIKNFSENVVVEKIIEMYREIASAPEAHRNDKK
ncbi:glycosyltransferase [bacterium]|nr:glycosyltransferase [bacterium]